MAPRSPVSTLNRKGCLAAMAPAYTRATSKATVHRANSNLMPPSSSVTCYEGHAPCTSLPAQRRALAQCADTADDTPEYRRKSNWQKEQLRPNMAPGLRRSAHRKGPHGLTVRLSTQVREMSAGFNRSFVYDI